MEAKEARRLRTPDRVCWDGDPSDMGTVVETGYCAVKIKWDNGQVGVVHFNDCERVTLIEPE